MSNDILISICIATYQRSTEVMKTLDSLLESSSDLFEVIINDDAGDLELFNKIKCVIDKRVHYFKNPTPHGQLKNMLDSYTRASGKYIMTLMDRDSISKKNIEYIIYSLQKYKPTVCITSYKDYLEIDEYELLYSENPIRFSKTLQSHHLSGLIFKRDIALDIINQDYDILFNKEIIGFFPIDYLLYKVVYTGSLLLINRQCYEMASDEYMRKNKSTATKMGNYLGMHALDINGIKFQFKKSIKLIENSSLITKEEKEVVINNLFEYYYYRCVFYTMSLYENKVQAEHSNIQLTKINILMIFEIGKYLRSIATNNFGTISNNTYFKVQKNVIKSYIKIKYLK